MSTLIQDFTRAQSDYTRDRLHTTAHTTADTTAHTTAHVEPARPRRVTLRHRRTA